MNLTSAIGSIGAAYATFKYCTAENRSEQKKALVVLTGSVALFAYGVFFRSNQEVDPAFQEALSKASARGGRVGELIKVFDETKGLTPDHFLPWNETFEASKEKGIIGIAPKDMSKSAMWGIDSMGRFFIALKGRCTGKLVFSYEHQKRFFEVFSDQTEKVQTVFQHHVGPGADEVIYGSAENVEYLCRLNRQTDYTYFPTFMKELLKKGKLEVGDVSLIGLPEDQFNRGEWLQSDTSVWS